MSLTVSFPGSGVPAIFSPRGLSFSSKLPGGNYELSFTMFGQMVDRFPVFRQPPTYAVLSDEAGKVLFYGRRARPGLAAGSSPMRYLGMWQSLWDCFFGNPGTGYTSPTYPDDIVKGILQQAAPLLDQGTSGIQRNAVDLAASADLPLQATKKAGDVLTDLLKYPDDLGRQWWAAVEPVAQLSGQLVNRLTYFPRDESPTYEVRLSDLDPSWQLETDYDQVTDSVMFEYSDPAGATQKSRLYHNPGAQSILGWPTSAYEVLDSRTRYTSSQIDAAAQLYLQEHGRPQQRTSGFTLKPGARLQPAGGGAPLPSYYLKAGDVLRIADLPIGESFADGNVDGLRCFSLVQVTYDHEKRTVVAVPGYPPDSLVYRLSRLGQAIKQLT